MGRKAAMIAGIVLASAACVMGGANSAGTPVLDEIPNYQADAAHTPVARATGIMPRVASYDIEIESFSDEVAAELAVPVEFLELAQMSLEQSVKATPAPVMPTGEQITAIGDSLMVGATPFMEELLPGISIDGRVGRPMPEGISILDELNAAGAVREYVVLGLATNAGVTVEQFDRIIAAIGPDRTLVMVNAYGDRSWIPGGNEQVEAAAAKYPGQIVVADWSGLITEHPEYIGPDGIHANNEGKIAYANLVFDALNAAAIH